jgi:hypothetical protein
MITNSHRILRKGREDENKQPRFRRLIKTDER